MPTLNDYCRAHAQIYAHRAFELHNMLTGAKTREEQLTVVGDFDAEYGQIAKAFDWSQAALKTDDVAASLCVTIVHATHFFRIHRQGASQLLHWLDTALIAAQKTGRDNLTAETMLRIAAIAAQKGDAHRSISILQELMSDANRHQNPELLRRAENMLDILMGEHGDRDAMRRLESRVSAMSPEFRKTRDQLLLEDASYLPPDFENAHDIDSPLIEDVSAESFERLMYKAKARFAHGLVTAWKYLEQCERIAKALDSPLFIGRVSMNAAMAGRLDQTLAERGLKAADHAIALFEDHGSYKAVADIHLIKAEIWQFMGRYEEADMSLRMAHTKLISAGRMSHFVAARIRRNQLNILAMRLLKVIPSAPKMLGILSVYLLFVVVTVLGLNQAYCLHLAS